MAARLTGFMGEGDLAEARTDFFALVAICKRQLGQSVRPAPVVYRDTVINFADLRQLLGLTDEEAQAGNANRILHRAAILHADVAMLVIPLLPGRTGCSARATVLVQDGNSAGTGCISFHWAHGRMLLDAVRPDPGKDEVARLWYLATITFLLEIGDFANANLQIDARPPALSGRPRDPVRARLLSRGVRVAARPASRVRVGRGHARRESPPRRGRRSLPPGHQGEPEVRGGPRAPRVRAGPARASQRRRRGTPPGRGVGPRVATALLRRDVSRTRGTVAWQSRGGSRSLRSGGGALPAGPVAAARARAAGPPDGRSRGSPARHAAGARPASQAAG